MAKAVCVNLFRDLPLAKRSNNFKDSTLFIIKVNLFWFFYEKSHKTNLFSPTLDLIIRYYRFL